MEHVPGFKELNKSCSDVYSELTWCLGVEVWSQKSNVNIWCRILCNNRTKQDR